MIPATNVEHTDAHGKALSLNLEGSIYGTLAEIGAGQEVARWFLRVGAASGTVAKTISAYDKTVSDEIYGAGTRYVSRERLLSMLYREYSSLLKRLSEIRGTDKRFFAFADTVATRNYQGTNQQHGWMGIRFQTKPGSSPSQILLHINLGDVTAQGQQQAIGILGVNLIYAVFHQSGDMSAFLKEVFDELSMARIEIDLIEVDGPAFSQQNSNEWCLALLYQKMAHAVLFDTRPAPVEPSGVLRKRPLLVMRGTCRHLELIDPELLHVAARRLATEGVRCERPPVGLIEMSVRHASGSEASATEMLQSIRQLSPYGPVIVSDLPETYRLSRYLRRHSTEPIRFVMSVAAAAKTLHETFYRDLPGSLLEGLGKLLATNVKLYVAPMTRGAMVSALGDVLGSAVPERPDNDIVEIDDLELSGPGKHIFEYLRSSGQIVELA